MRGDFEYELGALHIQMMVEFKVIFAPFLAFAFTYITIKAHNTLVLMLDPRFKSLDILKAFVGRAKVIYVMVEHDTKIEMFSTIGRTHPWVVALGTTLRNG